MSYAAIPLSLWGEMFPPHLDPRHYMTLLNRVLTVLQTHYPLLPGHDWARTEGPTWDRAPELLYPGHHGAALFRIYLGQRGLAGVPGLPPLTYIYVDLPPDATEADCITSVDTILENLARLALLRKGYP